jgi:hypothetical protein
MYDSLAELDQAIEAAARILQLARENSFDDCVAMITSDIRRYVLPGTLLLLCASVGNQRKAVARRYRRLLRMVAE